jgi:hypothetical protein
MVTAGPCTPTGIASGKTTAVGLDRDRGCEVKWYQVSRLENFPSSEARSYGVFVDVGTESDVGIRQLDHI